jgi:hypothetical protein
MNSPDFSMNPDGQLTSYFITNTENSNILTKSALNVIE